MNPSKNKRLLDKKNIDEVRLLASQKMNEYGKQNDILGEQIFNLLEQNSRVLYYPLEDAEIWGFYEKINDIPFVCINTSIEYDKQVFVAAHELYHLWFNHPEPIVLASRLEETEKPLSVNELRANRFASEFLIPELLLRQEIQAYGIDCTSITVEDVLKVSRLFVVPYKAMAKRFFEIAIITAKQLDLLYSFPEEKLAIMRIRLGLEPVQRKNPIELDNLIDKAMEAYEKHLITKEKLTYLLGFANLTPKAMGIMEEKPYNPPSDDELRSIMEE